DTGLVAYCRPRIRRAGRGLGRILATIAMHLIEGFCLRVVRLKLVVGDWPCGRDPTVMSQFAKVLLAQAKQRGTVKFCISSDIVIRMRMQVLAILVQPRFLRVVVSLNINNLRIPVGLLTRNIVATLKDQDLLVGG